MRRQWSILVLGFLVVALAATVAAWHSGLRASIPGLDEVRSAAEARRDGSDEPVLLVSGKPVTLAELSEMERWTAANLAWMREALAVTEDPHQRVLLEQQIAVMERYGTPTVALAALIRYRALEAVAEREGLWPDEATVRARVERDRALATKTDDPRLAAYLDAFGTQRYWEEWYPRVAAREIALERLYAARTGAEQDLSRRQALWMATERAIVRDAPVEVVAAEAWPASLEAARQYLDEYWALAERTAPGAVGQH